MRRPRPSQRPQAFRLNTASPLARGLVAAWLGQHAGTTLYHDALGQRHGTLAGFTGAGNTPAARWEWASQLGRHALRFDGSATRIPGLLPSLAGTSALTVSAWANPDAVNAYRYLVSDFNAAINNCSIGIAVAAEGDWFANIGGGFAPRGVTATAGAWAHLAATRAGNTAGAATALWRDRTSAAGTAAGNIASAGSLAVGCTGDGASLNWLGLAADVMVWSRVLTRDEIAALADPGNVDLRLGGVPLIQPIRRFVAVAVQPTATLSAAAQAASTGLAATVGVPGTLAAAAQAASTGLAATVGVPGTVAVEADAASADLAATIEVRGTFEATAQAASADLAGGPIAPCVLDARAGFAAAAISVRWRWVPPVNDRRDMLQWGLAALTTTMDAVASQPITYVVDDEAIEMRATYGPKLLKLDDGEGNIRLEWTDMDFCIPARYFVRNDEPFTPDRGHKIYLIAGETVQRFEVVPYGGESAWRWSDPHQSMLRVHAKHVGSEPYEA